MKEKSWDKDQQSQNEEEHKRHIRTQIEVEKQMRKQQQELESKQQRKDLKRPHKGMSRGDDTRPDVPLNMSREQQEYMTNMHQMQTLWVYWTLILLGIWLLMSPLTFSYGKAVVEPSGGRDVWLSLENRITAMRWSDIISGLLLIFFGWRSLTPGRWVSLWACCCIGVWLNLAPVIFWAPNAAAYVNDTLVGTLVIVLSILIPGIPDLIRIKKEGTEVPAGWSYNPSSWTQRSILIIGTFFGWIISRYLGAFQLGYIDHMWDPFFDEGSQQILNSDISHSVPVSDGALGAVAYTLEFLVIWIGGTARWRTLPWVVIFFAILVIPLGLVHIILILSQPVLVDAWCTLCLLTAAIALFLIPLEIDEVAATIQSSILEKRIGKSLWDSFWKSGEAGSKTKDERTPEFMLLPQQPSKVLKSAMWGVSFPWTLVASAVLGIWLMFAPAVFGFNIEDTVADINRMAGSLIIVVSVISMGELVRLGRFLNVLLGLAIAVIPWFVEDSTLALNLSGTISGLLVAALAIPRGPKTETYGMFDKYASI